MVRLPDSCEGPFRVRRVIDGDTFHLVNGTKVRVVGVDTPEMKERAPFAQEAADFATSLVGDKEVFLAYGTKEREDKYGRHLCVAYVAQGNWNGSNKAGKGNNYRCLNEELLANGLGYFYCPTPGSIPNEKDLLAAQTAARNNRLGLWRTFSDSDCYVTRNGRAYHSPTCDAVAGKSTAQCLKVSAALDRGLSPCRNCLNPDGIHATAQQPTSSGQQQPPPPSAAATQQPSRPQPRPTINAAQQNNASGGGGSGRKESQDSCCIIM